MAEERKKTEGKAKSWSKGLKAEFNKIVWTDKKRLGKQTIAVVAISVAICLIITIVDNLGLQVMQWILK